MVFSIFVDYNISDIASKLSQSVPRMSAFLFGTADLPLKRGLVERRKQVKWYDGQCGSHYDGVQHDVGAKPSSRYGLTGE